MRTLSLVLIAVLFVGGCASRDRGDHKPPKEVNVNTSVKTYVLDGLLVPLDPKGGDPANVLYANVIPDAPVARGVPIKSTLLPIYGIEETVGAIHHQFVALVGPDPAVEAEAEASISGSDPALLLAQGWVVLSGNYPMSQTGWVCGTAEGTSYILRRTPTASGGVTITGYNVSPAGGHRVKLRRDDGVERWLNPGQQVSVPETGDIPYPTGFKDVDATFLDHVKKLAASAGITLG